MLKMLVKMIASLVLVVAGTLSVAGCAEAETGPTRVMLVGDSITQGQYGDYTWRYFLWKSLQASPESFDFVGPRADVHRPEGKENAPGTGYADPNFDRDHASRWGMGMHWIDQWFGSETYSLGAGWTPAKLASDLHPDVVVNMLGFNDMNPGGWNISVTDVLNKQRQFIADFRAVNPDVTILLGKVGHSWVMGDKGVQYNAELDSLIAELSTPQSKIVAVEPAVTTYADTRNPYNNIPGEVWDPVHPSTGGYVKIAEAVRQALMSTGHGAGSVPAKGPVDPLMATPAVTKTSVKLGKVTQVRATYVHKKATVRWSTATNSAKTEVWKRVQKSRWTGWKKVSVKGGKYSSRTTAKRVQFKLRPVSETGKVGAWTPRVTVTR